MPYHKVYSIMNLMKFNRDFEGSQLINWLVIKSHKLARSMLTRLTQLEHGVVKKERANIFVLFYGHMNARTNTDIRLKLCTS
jgi:hypothetical protein